jgi:hypothetical protein
VDKKGDIQSYEVGIASPHAAFSPRKPMNRYAMLPIGISHMYTSNPMPHAQPHGLKS